jgi:hypothetical protein
MSQTNNFRRKVFNRINRRCLAVLFILLISSSYITPAQTPVCLPTREWSVYLASRAALFLLRSAKQAPQQNNSTQQLWKASKASTAAQNNEPANTRDLWATMKGEANQAAKVAPSETSSAPNEMTSVATKESARPLTPAELLASSRTIFIKSNSVWVKRKSIEDSLMKKKGFLELGYAITKDLSEADLKLEVDHTALTLRYPFTVTHMQTQIVVASGTVISLRILNDVPGDTANSFVKQARAARATAASKTKN